MVLGRWAVSYQQDTPVLALGMLGSERPKLFHCYGVQRLHFGEKTGQAEGERVREKEQQKHLLWERGVRAVYQR